MKRGEVMAMLAVAGQVYGRTIGDPLVDVWGEFMGDLTADEGIAAMKRHIAESPHFPTVADIRKRVAATRVGEMDLAGAWETVRKAIQRCGRWHEPQWESGPVAAAVGAIGWAELCNTLDSDLPTVRAQFERYYRAAFETRLREENADRLLEGQEQKRIGPKSVRELMAEQQGRLGGSK